MRMLHTCSVIAALLTAMTVCNSTSAMMCADADDDGSTRLKKLHEYAQIAEAPKQNDLGYMEDCIDISGVVLAEKMTNVVELTVPENFIRLVRNVADNNRAILRPSQRRWNGGNSPFSVGCSAERNNENVLIDFGFKLLASIVGDRAFFFLTGTEMKGTVVVRETGERILISPGTNVFNLPEVMANFEGEDCAFPLVKQTVDVLCEALRDPMSEAYRALLESNISQRWLFSSRQKSFTMVGHSLGGSATQFVALNIPYHCQPEDNSFTFEAYAFSSPGLRDNQDGGQSQQQHLHGFIIDGDWLLHEIFPDRLQSGDIFIFTSTSRQFCPAHLIEEVQASICLCLQGRGGFRWIPNNSNGVSNGQILNDDFCRIGTLEHNP